MFAVWLSIYKLVPPVLTWATALANSEQSLLFFRFMYFLCMSVNLYVYLSAGLFIRIEQ